MLKVRLRQGAEKAGATVVPVAEGGALPQQAHLAARVAAFSGKAGEACEIFAPAGRMLLVGIGKPDAADAERAGALVAARLAEVSRVAIDARGMAPEIAVALAAGAVLRAWRYAGYKTQPEADAPCLAALDLLTDDRAALRPLWQRTEAVLRGVAFARDLVAEPANTLTPATFCDRLAAFTSHGLTLEVLKPKVLTKAGLGALQAVGGGAVHKPRLAVLRWRGTLDAPPVAFIGKGITFDTGGICIKPANRMWEMRADMAGAAACAGALLALALRNSPASAVAVLPLAENATGGASYRPGDVLRICDGTTVEVVDTDAEGRLVLADALAWTRQHVQPRAMIDLATLTGSIVTALGHHMAGLFDNDAALAVQVAAVGAMVGERVWRMPIADAHREDLKSDIADLRNCTTGRLQPDACHAAAFLHSFAGDTPWAHLDIAGVEAREQADDAHAAGPTGFGVRLLDRLTASAFEAPV